MALTKGDAVVDACQEIAQNTVLEGANVDVSGDYDAYLQLWLALTTETGHTGTEVIVQSCVDAASNEDWGDIDRFVALIGTANQQVLSGGGEGIGDTLIEVADTTGYVTNGVWLFLEDAGTFANSEWVRQKAYATNTSITIVDGLARAKDNADTFSNVAQTRQVRIPFSARQARVIVNNSYDADGSTVAYRCKIGRVTAVS